MSKEDIQKELDKNHDRYMVIYHDVVTSSNRFGVHIDGDILHFSGLRLSMNNLDYFGKYTPLRDLWPTWGSDPEFFFEKDGKVIPSSQVIPEGGYGDVIRDGIQGELNPGTNSCRQVAGNNIFIALDEARQVAERKGVEVSLKTGITVDHETFYSVPEDERRFGCSPTKNVHETTRRLTGTRTQFRSGGGHVHMGSQKLLKLYDENPVKLISMFDIFCGVTCVLIDRDEANKERRKHYGRAGEHRKKRYGLEYRVPSNFWLRSYTLWSMVAVLLRNAMNVATHDEISDEILAAVDINDVRKAINENDYDLALEIFDKFTAIIKKHHVVFDGGLSFYNVELFRKWATSADPIAMLNVNTFNDSLTSWEEHYEYGDVSGIESFILHEIGGGTYY